jgi:hypothetical protein
MFFGEALKVILLRVTVNLLIRRTNESGKMYQCMNTYIEYSQLAGAKN